MTEHMNEEMLNAMASVQEVKVGDLVQGEVLTIDDNKQAIVGIIGAGVEGVIPLKELSTITVQNVTDVVNIGDIIDVVVISEIGKDKENGSYLLSKRRVDAKKVWEDIEKAFAAGETIEAPVTDVVKGGLVVDAGVRGFVPASMVDVQFVSDFSDYKGKTLTYKIIEIEPSENRLILSRRAVLEAEKEVAKKEIMDKILAGDVVEGTVARLTNFGAFIDLGGVDGLVHVSEISYSHVVKPEDVLSVGDKVTVKVLSIDPEKERISLSIKETLPGPWDNVESEAAVGSVLEGKVNRLTSFGAFVEILPGVEGLVHISQISHKHIATPHEALEEGQTVTVKVLDVSKENKRIGLSIKALEEKEDEVVVEEETYVMPEESTGFTLGDMVNLETTEED
ncbi:30S ribosomal protein S1 [Vagococcus fluvialis]|uniref:30S ribosomal protein S1 n=1 Tax=Vagococcus fluvialis TaxID=2738 RepID=A0A369B5E5_9ENTE|nr:30S ribosomal protein S1 [Vagococcus fluvialis]MBO0478969.1 30S ribosomal protein S1 [Vagococcus fluvialis]MBO0484043.1 30S ribosomal protein S1 [Vagococcus fluvialis]MDT2746267.1 30S ribosomal protein S1 [Vagococcus fluvialis]RCX15776.1 small subunit ribosomal protein S1 [Vagococcus fluvialis]RSU04340.1 30S ribosomal protein S1 [Vagococcus fluvialis]